MVKQRSSSRSSSWSGYTENSHQFFKIYLPHYSSQRLRIPPAFIKYFKGVLLSKYTLKTSCSKIPSWCVDVKKVDNCFFFEKGWPEFVQGNSLESEDFLVFCYTGESEFYVSIFGKNNCPKEFSLVNTENDDKQRQVLRGTRTHEHSNFKEKMCVSSNVKNNTARKFGSKKPFFETVLKPSYLNNGFINIPVDFARRYLSKHQKTARLKHSNKTWLVTLIHHKTKIVVFTRGWRKFVVDNGLREGDVCRFEMVRGKNDYAFNVAILRGKSKERRKETGKRTVEENTKDASSEFISNNPFFRITLTPTYANKGFLNVPSSFRNGYMNRGRRTVRLQHSNKWWNVKAKGYGSRGFNFSGGWTKFAKENSLQAGDVCIFELINMENYVFNVSIVRGNPKERRGRNNKEEGSKKIEDASTNFISSRPFFQTTMSPTYVSKGFLNISSRFQTSYMNKRKATARLQCSNKWWEVSLKGYGRTSLKFCGGWNKFATENSLQVGDICRFELIDMEDYAFKVSIAKGTRAY